MGIAGRGAYVIFALPDHFGFFIVYSLGGNIWYGNRELIFS